MVTTGAAAVKERIDSERNQGRAPDMGWLDHDRLGFNYRLSDVACALGLAQLDRLDDMLAARGRVAGWYRELLGGVEGLELPCADAGGDERGWFVFVVQLPHGVDRDAAVARAARARRAVQALPARHPPDELLPRALRPSRGRVPGLRGRRRALDRAAVLPALTEGQSEAEQALGGLDRGRARIHAWAGISGTHGELGASARSASCSRPRCRSCSGARRGRHLGRLPASSRATSSAGRRGCSWRWAAVLHPGRLSEGRDPEGRFYPRGAQRVPGLGRLAVPARLPARLAGRRIPTEAA